MMRTSLLLLALSSILPACATVPEDELGGNDSQDGEEGKGDAAAAYTFWTVKPDLRACSFNARCGGYFVSRVNRTTNTCAPGVSKARCYIDNIDLNGTAMPASVQESYEKRLRDGEDILVRAELDPGDLDRVLLNVTEIWVPNAENAKPEGVFVMVKDNGIRCITAPCPSIGEQRLNSSRAASISEIDFDASGADNKTIERAREGLYNHDGVIVVGDREYGSRNAKIRTATQFYTKAPVPLH